MKSDRHFIRKYLSLRLRYKFVGFGLDKIYMTKVIERHLWEEFREYADEIRHTMEWKEIYPQRKETIERVFADCKENNGLRFTRLKGLKKNQQNAWLIFACHNLKKMSLWRGKYRRKPSKNSINPSKYTKKDNFILEIAYIQ